MIRRHLAAAAVRTLSVLSRPRLVTALALLLAAGSAEFATRLGSNSAPHLRGAKRNQSISMEGNRGNGCFLCGTGRESA